MFYSFSLGILFSQNPAALFLSVAVWVWGSCRGGTFITFFLPVEFLLLTNKGESTAGLVVVGAQEMVKEAVHVTT